MITRWMLQILVGNKGLRASDVFQDAQVLLQDIFWLVLSRRKPVQDLELAVHHLYMSMFQAVFGCASGVIPQI